MIFTETELAGAFIIDLEPRQDTRGFFARGFCAREFEAHRLNPVVVQCNVAFNHSRGTVRGMHYQKPPAAEAKLIRCTQGAIFDVIIDLRPGSRTFRTHFAVELTAQNRRALYVPASFAHGYQTLTDQAEVVYQMSEFYAPERETGLHYDDPMFNVRWPLPVSVISERDAGWPRFGSGD